MILHTNVIGNGEPIVFLHTGLQTGVTDFEYQREYFKDKYRVILPDLRGHGKSLNENLSNFFEDSAHDLANTFNKLEIEKAHIVGCSLGALVGFLFAKRYPNKTTSLTISGILPEKPENWSEMNKFDLDKQSELFKNENLVSYFDKIHATNWRKFLQMNQSENWYPFYATNDLEGIECQVMYIVGEGNWYETKGAVLYPRMKNNVHVSIIPFASHLVHTEQPEIYTTISREVYYKYL